MIKIDHKLLDELIAGSRKSARKRIIHRFHKADNDPLQRMLNTMQPGTYLQPHKHENPDKREVFIALKGKFVLVEFDDYGSIREFMILDPKNQKYAAEIGPRNYHTIICLEPDSVIYELKDGPYDPQDDKHFAEWAPKEGEQGCDDYLHKILTELNIPSPR